MKNYIFILAEDGDSTVDEVMQWLEYSGEYEVLRINHTDRIRFLNISISNQCSDFEICINEQLCVKLSQIHAYWYRRGELLYPSIFVNRTVNPDLAKSMQKYYADEFEHSIDMLHFMLKSSVANHINAFEDIYTNKLINLECARQAGLKIPDSLVSNQPDVIKAFLSKHPKCIAKPIRYPGGNVRSSNHYICYSQTTHMITIGEVDEFLRTHDVFQPTHFQEYIDKEFEIRTFILNGRLFSMAIFSQQNEKTKIDFRNYDEESPNRNVPFQLPDYLEKQLIDFCQLIGINCGSMDILYQKGEYYFLEINPVGQLQWLSRSCNYAIEKHIAKTLINL